MADNIGVRPSTTTGSVNVATDDIGGVHYPIYKQAYGSDGEAISVDLATPLPVTTVEHLTSFTEEYTADGSGNIAAVIAFSPSAGNHIDVQIINVSSDAAGGTVNMDFLTSSIIVFRAYFTKTAASASAGLHIEGATDEPVTISGTGLGAGKKVFVSISYADHAISL